MLELSPVLLSSQLIRLVDNALELILDLDSLPPGDGRRLAALLFDDLRDSLDILSELSFVQREEYAEQLTRQITELLDAGIVLMGGSYDRGISSPEGQDSWRGAVIKASLIPAKSEEQAAPTMSVEAASALALAQVRIDKGEFGPAEEGLQPLAAAGNGHALLVLGTLLRDQGRLDEAAETLRKAVDAGRDEALTPLGMCLRELGQLDEAESVLVRATERQREQPT
jgi:tetratricopeptide (TPR) repeat protein